MAEAVESAFDKSGFKTEPLFEIIDNQKINSMDLKLKNKTALVTGSTSGIGYAIAKSLAEEGAKVLINGRSATEVDRAIKKLRSGTGNQNIGRAIADFTKVEEVNAMIEEHPRVDILVNNIGITDPKDFNEITDGEWKHIYEVNVLSGVRLSRAYFDKMLKKNWGRIIFISSESAVQIPAEMIQYGVSKTAVLSLSRGLAELTVGSDVTVNAVLPGPTSTEAFRKFLKASAQQQGISDTEMEKVFFNSMRPSSLLKRFIEPVEIANTVTYLASPLSSATNGAALRVDGGVIKSVF